jgi:hypothetical protein
MSLCRRGSLICLQAGQHVGFVLPLGDQLRTGLALRVDGVEGAIGPARFVTFAMAPSI